MRSYSSPISPDLFESGDIARSTGVEDEYFKEEGEEAVRMVLHVFMDMLPKWEREAIEMTIMKRYTYEEAAKHISLARGKRTDKKTVWKWTRVGMERLRGWLAQAEWASHMTGMKIPMEDDDGES